VLKNSTVSFASLLLSKTVFRPHFSEGDTPREIVTIAKRCWIEKPEERMTFKYLTPKIY